MIYRLMVKCSGCGKLVVDESHDTAFPDRLPSGERMDYLVRTHRGECYYYGQGLLAALRRSREGGAV